MKIVFFGTAHFGIPALQMIYRKHEIAAVVSTPPRPRGRGLTLSDSPIVEYAHSLSIKSILLPESLSKPDFIEQIRSFKADCFIVVAFKILPRQVFSIPPLGTYNIHASLLPAYRGPAPIQRAIEAGEKKTGVTLFRIDEGMDTGDIVLQATMAIGDDETTPELYEKLSRKGAESLSSVLDAADRGYIELLPQNSALVSKAPKLKKEEALIHWNESSVTIYNKIRAFKPFPGTYTFLYGRRLGIEWAKPVESNDDRYTENGTVCFVTDESFDVKTGEGMLRVLYVKPEGRKCMPVRDFLNGKGISEGTVLHE